MIEKITQENYSAQVEHSGKPVVLCFYASWCEQCQRLLPELEKIAAEKADFFDLKSMFSAKRLLNYLYRVKSVYILNLL